MTEDPFRGCSRLRAACRQRHCQLVVVVDHRDRLGRRARSSHLEEGLGEDSQVHRLGLLDHPGKGAGSVLGELPT